MSIRSFQQHTPKLGARVFVDPTAVVLGDVEIGEDSSVWPLTVIRGGTLASISLTNPEGMWAISPWIVAPASANRLLASSS